MELDFSDINGTEEFASERGVISTPGEYHLLIADVNFGYSLDGETHHGDRIVVKFESLGELQKGATTQISLFNVKGSDSEKGSKMKLKKQLFFLVAVGLVSIDQIAEGNVPTFDFDNDEFRERARQRVTGRHVCAKLVKALDERFMDINYSDIYHIDDPRIVHYSKDEEAIKALPAEQRIDAATFHKLIASGAPKPAAKAAAVSDEELDQF